jgi:predicted nucleotidyltransferase
LFRRLHHQRVAEVLSTLNAPLLAEHNCWFGGETAIVLANGEFRESADIDFLVSDRQSYRTLRQLVRDRGLDALATRELDLGRAPSIDGYGIRTSVLVAGDAIKFEIIHEGRIDLDTPSPGDEICGLRILTRTDMVASKLLANDDRWADTSTFSRDLIDLAMMKPDTAALEAGARKAVDAYGKTVGEGLDKAVGYLRERPHRLDEYIRALKIDAPRAVVWQSIRDLSARCAKIKDLG